MMSSSSSSDRDTKTASLLAQVHRHISYVPPPAEDASKEYQLMEVGGEMDDMLTSEACFGLREPLLAYLQHAAAHRTIEESILDLDGLLQAAMQHPQHQLVSVLLYFLQASVQVGGWEFSLPLCDSYMRYPFNLNGMLHGVNGIATTPTVVQFLRVFITAFALPFGIPGLLKSLMLHRPAGYNLEIHTQAVTDHFPGFHSLTKSLSPVHRRILLEKYFWLVFNFTGGSSFLSDSRDEIMTTVCYMMPRLCVSSRDEQSLLYILGLLLNNPDAEPTVQECQNLRQYLLKRVPENHPAIRLLDRYIENKEIVESVAKHKKLPKYLNTVVDDLTRVSRDRGYPTQLIPNIMSYVVHGQATPDAFSTHQAYMQSMYKASKAAADRLRNRELHQAALDLERAQHQVSDPNRQKDARSLHSQEEDRNTRRRGAGL